MKHMSALLAAPILALAFAGSVAAQMGKPPIPMTLSEYANASTGQAVQIVVRVESRNRSAMHAELLQRVGDLVYRSTGKHVELYVSDETPVIMGTAGDVKPGAVLYVYGVATRPNMADVKRLVIDTQYVKVL